MLSKNLNEIMRAELDEFAKTLGFIDVGYAKSEELTREKKNMEQWLQQNYHGKMSYLEQHFDKRFDPNILLPDTKTIISLIHPYFTKKKIFKNDDFKIANYAMGEDYHVVIKEKLNQIIRYLENKIGSVQARGFVDSAPIMERAWAEKAGLGWIGKNSLLLSKKKGSYFFISEILIDVPLAEFEIPSMATDYCGSCTKCIDACPTEAIVLPQVIDSNKCISYLTIEYKDELMPSEMKDQFSNWIFGCDICQQVCPINAKPILNTEPRFEPNEDFINLSKHDFLSLTEDRFKTVFKNSAVKRTKFKGLARNIKFVSK